MKKNIVMIISLTLIIVLFIGIYIFYTNSSDNSECITNLKERYESQIVEGSGIIIVFNEKLSESEINFFASKNGLELKNFWLDLNTSFFQITDGSDIYEKICLLKNDNQIKTVDPNTVSGINE